MDENYKDGFCVTCNRRVYAYDGHWMRGATYCKDCWQLQGGTVGTPTTVGQALTGLEIGQSTVVDLINDLTRADGTKVTGVQFTLVKNPKPLSVTPPRSHVFSAVDGYVAYLKKVAPNAVVLCEAGDGHCRAVLDESAKNGVEVVDFIPRLHPTWLAWAQTINKKLTAMQLAEFVQKQRRSITDGPKLAATLRQIKASTKQEVLQGRGNGSVNGVTITTKIQGKDADQDVDLPETIIVTTPLYIDSEKPAKIELDLLLEGNGTQVLATLTAPTLDVLLFEEAKEYATKFEGFQFGFGTVSHGSWKFAE